MNLITLPLGNARHHLDKFRGFFYLLLEAFMRVFFCCLYETFVPFVSRQAELAWVANSWQIA